jgi:hypothetical protein
VVNVPLVGWIPLHAPLAVQEVALALLQVSVDVDPDVTLPGLAESVSVGGGNALTATVADCAAVPPVPVQVSV